jgi:high-affinity iron transporter
MFAAALIVFRELLEAALIVTILMAATRGVPRRGFWISLGIAGGLAGAGAVAALTSAISSLFEGAGQEIVNAAILFTAVGLIGWHVVWMNVHGRRMAAEMRAAGSRIAEGEGHMSALALVVGLAVMREGSEVVLMLEGLWTSGAAHAMLGGAAMGVGAGLFVSCLMYLGFVALPVARIFSLTNILLVLIASGMAARGADFLTQAGLVSPFGNNIWDTAAILSEQSAAGQILSALVGYIARPSGIEIAAYAATLVLISTLMARAKKHARTALAVVTACVLVAAATATPAFAIDKVYSPSVTKGEFELEYGGSTTFDNNAEKNNLQAHETELEYGLTDRVQLELSGAFEKQPGESLQSDAVGFGGRYQFTEQGEYWVDSGLLMTYNWATHRDVDPDTIEAKLLLEKQTGSFLHRANIGIEQDVGAHASGGPDRVFLWNSRYMYDEHFAPGFEIQSDFGKGNEVHTFDQQLHYIGPAMFGQIIPNLKYEAAYYVGVSKAASAGAARLLLEYEMYFN